MSSSTQRNFAGGEIAPALYGRADLQKYATALRTLRNFICLRHGGVANRGGTEYAAPTKGNDEILFMDFVFGDDSLPYVLEFGDQSIRFYQDGAQLLNGATPWTNLGPAYVVGDIVTDSGVTYYCVTAHVPVLPPPNVNWVVVSDTVLEVPTPYLLADLLTTPFQWVQSADVITIVHPLYAPMELRRYSNTRWTLTTKVIGTSSVAPTGIAVAGAAGPGLYWGVTAFDVNGVESAVNTSGLQAVAPSGGSPATITWLAVSGALRYAVYRSDTGPDGLRNIGVSAGLSFLDYGLPLEGTAPTTPTPYNPFQSTDDYPAAVGMYQQRMLFAATNNNPEKVWASRVGDYGNFDVVFPVQDDSPVSFTVAGRKVNRVRQLLDIDRLVLLTSGGEYTARGDQDGALTPTTINLKQQLYHGSAPVTPAVIGNVVVFVQARGSIVRDFMADLQQSYRTGDLTLYAPHLFAGYTVRGMAFQQTPHSTLWLVRSDGILLGLTYLPEEDIWGWHRHDTDGLVENVCVVPEGDEDRLYLCVKRTISGVDVRYVERMVSRTVTPLTDPRDLVFVDAALTYDGRNVTGTTMTLTGGVAWDHGESLTLEASAAFFSAGDVGNAIFLTDTDGSTLVELDIEVYTSTTIVTVRPQATVPVGSRGVATTSWSRAVETFSGLDHLEGKEVSILGDATVVSSPYGPDAPSVVTGGSVVLDAPYAVVHVGLPYLSDFETLDLDSPQGPSLKTSRMVVNRVTLMVDQSSVFYAGIAPPTDDTVDALEDLNAAIIRDDTDDYDALVLRTGTYDVTMEGRYTDNGRVFVRMVDPLPLTILAAMPQGAVPPAV